VSETRNPKLGVLWEKSKRNVRGQRKADPRLAKHISLRALKLLETMCETRKPEQHVFRKSGNRQAILADLALELGDMGVDFTPLTWKTCAARETFKICCFFARGT